MFQYQYLWPFTVWWLENSLYGANAMHGTEGINFYTKLKTITSRWPQSVKSGPEFKMQQISL